MLLNQVIGLSALVIGLTAITSGVATSPYRLAFIIDFSQFRSRSVRDKKTARFYAWPK